MKWHFQLIILFALFVTQASMASDQQGTIESSTFNYQVYNDRPYVFSVGYIVNDSEYPLDDITIAVQYYDAKGELIDAAFENLYSLSVPPNDKVAFKVQTFASKNKEFYASHETRIVSSRQDIPCNQATKRKSGNSAYDIAKKYS